MARIIITEDETIIAEDLRFTLTKMGHDVLAICDNGKELLQRVHKTEPDLIFMDINLSGKMSGLEAAEKILQKKRIPIVFCTAYSDIDTKKQITKLGSYGYILKPFVESDIKEILCKIS